MWHNSGFPWWLPLMSNYARVGTSRSKQQKGMHLANCSDYWSVHRWDSILLVIFHVRTISSGNLWESEAVLYQTQLKTFRIPFQIVDLKKHFGRGQNSKEEVKQLQRNSTSWISFSIFFSFFSVNKSQDFKLKFVYNCSRITILVCSQPHDIWVIYRTGDWAVNLEHA